MPAATAATLSLVRVPRTATRAMDARRAATASTAAPTWTWLTVDAGTPGGSFGASPATTVATPVRRTSRARAGRQTPAGAPSPLDAPSTSSPPATSAVRTSHAHGRPSDASRLTVSVAAS